MVEFAFVVVLLIALLYGIITYGLILAAQATITQAAADGARAGIVASSTAIADGRGPGRHDVGWMGKGDLLATHVRLTIDHLLSRRQRARLPVERQQPCLKVTVTYNYSSCPLFPDLPGLGVITPSTISSTNILQMSNPSS